MERVYAALGLSLPDFDFSRVHPAHGPYDPGSAEWVRYRHTLVLPERR
jgi:hypothetical protein